MKSILLCLAALVAACGAIDLGHVQNLHVAEFGTGYIKIAWDFVEGDPAYALHKYSLTIDDDLTSEFKCNKATCSKTIEDLDACVEHVFDLTPIFYTPTGDDIPGDLITAKGYTTDELPGAVSGIKVTADTDKETSLKWNPPIVNAKCVDAYDVCFRLDKQTDLLCEVANVTSVTMSSLSACALYHVTVVPVTPSGKVGPKYEDVFTTHDGVPGKPTDVEVGLITEETIQLLWNNPTENFLCLEKFQITIGETHAKWVKPAKKKTLDFDNEFTFTPLFSCTDYTIDICSANAAEMVSEKVIKYASTNETEPLAPPHVTVNPSGPNTIEVNWGDNENDRCSGGFVVCWYDGVHPIEQCQEVGGDGDNSLTVPDLAPCSHYDISVSVQSPNGSFVSGSTTNSTSTEDVRPGPVVDLHTTYVDTDRLTVKCLPPEVDPQCVKEFITRVIDEEQRSMRVVRASEYEETITGLKACTDYRILVTTRSPSGLESEARETRNTTLAEVPSEPQEFAVVEFSRTSIKLQWFQPATNPRCVSSYDLTWDSASPGHIVVDGDLHFKMEHTEEGLTPCTDYTFSLFADSSVGPGPETTLTQKTAC